MTTPEAAMVITVTQPGIYLLLLNEAILPSRDMRINGQPSHLLGIEHWSLMLECKAGDEIELDISPAHLRSFSLVPS
jgi:hypothetical protein